MALMIPNGPCFAHWTDNFTLPPDSTPDGLTGFGVGITCGASSADGTAVTVLPALAHDCEYLWLGITGTSTSSQANAALMDLLIDPAGGTSWASLIDDLMVGSAYSATMTGATPAMPLEYHFPLWLPAGASVGARIRMQNATVPTGTRIMAQVFGGNKNPGSWWCGQKVETVGTMDPANSIGQAHTPGGQGAFSSWTSLGGPTGARAGALQYAVGGSVTSSAAARVYDFQFGADSVQIGPRVFKGMSGSEHSVSIYRGPVFCDIPAATQLQVRGACNTTLALGPPSQTILDVAAYLVQ